MFESHAQNLEDVVLWRALRHVEHGTYVDVGAADPDEDSVTKAFYERGWTGLNVEPAQDYADRLRQARPEDVTLQVCAGDHTGTVTFHHVLGTGLSSVVESSIDALAESSYEVTNIDVPMKRLDDLLTDAGFADRPIHFLKIDVEGFEESVIRGIDLSVWRPWVIVAEATAPNSTQQVHQQWEPLLLGAGYEFCLFDGLNRFYVAGEHAELRDLLSYPAGVFDQPFSSPPHAELLREYDKLAKGSEELRSVHEHALTAYDGLHEQLQASLTSYARVEGLYQSTIESYHRLEEQYQSTVDGYARLEIAYQEGVDGYSNLTREYHQALAENERLVAEHKAILVSMNDENDRLREGVASMSAEFDGLRDERDAARRDLELTHRTLSWRVTRPLRAVRRRVPR